MGYVSLPEFKYPTNALLNLQPLNDAIDSHTRNAFQNRKLDMEDRRVGMDEERLGMTRQEFARAQEERQQQLNALTALKNDPETLRRFGPNAGTIINALTPGQAAGFLAKHPEYELERGRTAAQIEASRASTAVNRAQLEQMRYQTPESRAQIAEANGMVRGSPEHRQFVLMGTLPQVQQPKTMEVNGKVVAIPANGGQASVVYDGGQNFDKIPEYAAKAAGFTSRMVESENNTRRITQDPKKFDPTSVGTGMIRSMLPEAIGNVVARSPEMQQYEQSAEQWIRAFLRKESGAAIGRDEFARDFKVYFPQPGDTPEVIKQKEQARLDAMRSFQMETRGFFDHTSPQQASRLKGWLQPRQNPALDEARDAIQRGASREKVIERLRQNGIDPSGL